MELQKQFVATNIHRTADKNAIAGAARQVYSRPHAKRIIAELPTATNARCLALIFNLSTWARAKGIGIDAEMLFADQDDLDAAAGIVRIPEFYAAPAGASRRQMARLWANFRAMQIAPATALEICKELDGRPAIMAAQSWRETSRGFVGRCVGWSDAQLRAKGIARPANPIDFEASDLHPRDEYAAPANVLDGGIFDVRDWLADSTIYDAVLAECAPMKQTATAGGMTDEEIDSWVTHAENQYERDLEAARW